MLVRSLAVAVLAAIALPIAGSATSPHPAAARTNAPCAAVIPNGWLHTSGSWIVDAHGCEKRLLSVTWYGMNTTNYVPAGLDFRSYTAILSEIKHLGFNSIRLPVSEEMVRLNSLLHVKARYIKKDPELKGLHPLQVLDRIVKAAKKAGLYIIPDNHVSVASSPDSSNIEALWNHYSTKGWITDWQTLAARYKNNPTVVGFDLRDEPHTDGSVPWTLKRYLTHGATWGKYPSKLWKPNTDWASAATQAGNAVLAVNPHALIFVEGVELYPDPARNGGVAPYWWGSNLKGVKVDPIILKVPHQLVYSPHEWGPRKGGYGHFTKTSTYQSMSKVLNANWGYILTSSNPEIQAPIWLGEFNTCNASPTCAKSKRAGSQGLWFQWLIQYLKKNPEISWGYFPINGTNAADQVSNNSILDPTWTTPKLPSIMTTLRTIMTQPAHLAPTG